MHQSWELSHCNCQNYRRSRSGKYHVKLAAISLSGTSAATGYGGMPAKTVS
jgi:hypothetical protein